MFWDVLALLTVPALVLLNGLFVAAEFALVSVRKTRIEELAARGVKGARAVEKAMASLDRSIAATQLGITFASIALGFIGEPDDCSGAFLYLASEAMSRYVTGQIIDVNGGQLMP